MILKKFDDIADAIKSVYSNLNYKNVSTIDKSNIIRKNRRLIHNFDDDVDQIMFHALNQYDNLNAFVIFGKNKSSAYKYYEAELIADYSLYGIKYIEIKPDDIIKIVYQLLFSRVMVKNKLHLIDYIKENYNLLWRHITDEKANLYDMDVTILIVCKRDIKKKYPSHDIITDNYIVYFPNTEEETRIVAGIFFCSGSMQFIKIQNFDFFLTKDNIEAKNIFIKFRKWFFENIDNSLKEQFILFSSVVLYLIGHRSMNDLDIYSHTIPEDIQNKISILLEDESCNEMFDISIKNPIDPKKWPKYWDQWLDTWAQKCGAKYFEEILCNPKYHFYFAGMKVISLDCDVIRRLERGRPRAYADLISLRKRYSYRISIPEIPDSIISYHKLDELSEDEKRDLLEKGAILDENNNELQLKTPTDIQKFINTIIFALQSRYRMKFTEDDIRKELNMKLLIKYDNITDKIPKKILKKSPEKNKTILKVKIVEDKTNFEPKLEKNKIKIHIKKKCET